jgi:hypothetical protein
MMKKLVIPFSLVAAATLAACSTERVAIRVTDQPAVTVSSAAYVYPSGYILVTERPYLASYPYLIRPGFGRVESYMPVYYTSGTATGYNRLRLTMQDGTVQIIDTNGPSVAVGTWVEVTPQLALTYPVAAR